MSTVVHHASMYANQAQAATGGTVLAHVVTKVAGGPATFNGLAPSTKAELDQYNATGDFSGASLSAWASNQWVDLGRGRYYTWDGNSWETIGLATGISSLTGPGERLFTGGRAPKKDSELLADDFGATTAWTGGQYVTLGGTGSGGAQYHWDGSDWVAGAAAATVPGVPTSVAGTGGTLQAVLTWTAPANNGGSAITDYSIEVFAAGGGAPVGVTGATVRLKGANTTGYTFTGLSAATGYTFKVKAVNAVGTSAASSASATITTS